jgi:catechol 2,3-dioxygenase-like lactoylglutathione lyase family enzyme
MAIQGCELHHTAYRVPNIEKSLHEWCARFDARVELPPTLVSADRVLVAFLLFSTGRVELVQSADFPAKAPPPGKPDHVCFLCSDFDARVARVRDEGGIVARPPVPSEAFGMRRMCFVLYGDVGLVELVEREDSTVS